MNCCTPFWHSRSLQSDQSVLQRAGAGNALLVVFGVPVVACKLVSTCFNAQLGSNHTLHLHMPQLSPSLTTPCFPSWAAARSTVREETRSSAFCTWLISWFFNWRDCCNSMVSDSSNAWDSRSLASKAAFASCCASATCLGSWSCFSSNANESFCCCSSASKAWMKWKLSWAAFKLLKN